MSSRRPPQPRPHRPSEKSAVRGRDIQSTHSSESYDREFSTRKQDKSSRASSRSDRQGISKSLRTQRETVREQKESSRLKRETPHVQREAPAFEEKRQGVDHAKSRFLLRILRQRLRKKSSSDTQDTAPHLPADELNKLGRMSAGSQPMPQRQLREDTFFQQQATLPHKFSARTAPDWKIVWEGQNRTHQISVHMIAIIGFAALAALIVVTPLSSFIAQQEQIRSLSAELETRHKHISELEQSIALWNDPDYVRAQARDRLGYVMPGETLYIVSGGADDPAKAAQEKIDRANNERRAITPFYVTMWDSISIAGKAAHEGNPQNVPVLNKDAGNRDSDKQGVDNQTESGENPGSEEADKQN
ncbi:Septum formation initiator [Chlamydia trachomatis]|nr:Septum formation initiator [Chlamydia trachomatis]